MADLKSPNFLKYYDDEKYLIGVSQTFRDSGLISPEDFLTILAWKANRATTYHRWQFQRSREGNYNRHPESRRSQGSP